MFNLGKKSYKILKGDKIAQAIVHKIPAVEIRKVEKLSGSERGKGGFGSTGKK